MTEIPVERRDQKDRRIGMAKTDRSRRKEDIMEKDLRLAVKLAESDDGSDEETILS